MPLLRKEIAVELREEDGGGPGCPMVGLITEILVRQGDAAANFQKEIQKFMKEGFLLGEYNARTSFHAGRGLKVMVHRKDFASSGTRKHLQWLRSKLEQRYEIKTSVIGHRQGETKEGGVLNGVLRACEQGWAYEENQRHSYGSRSSS